MFRLSAVCSIFYFLLSISAFADVKIIGEAAHGYEPVIEQEISILKGESRSCLFLELSPSATKSMQDYVSGRSSYENSIGAWESEVSQLSGEPFTNIVPSSLLDAARSTGLRVFGVDSEIMDSSFRAQNDRAIGMMRTAGANEKVWNEIAEIVISARNQAMAGNIYSLLKSGSCTNSFYIVGSSHTKTTYQDIPVIPVQTLLSSLGVATTLTQTSLCSTNCGSGLFH